MCAVMRLGLSTISLHVKDILLDPEEGMNGRYLDINHTEVIIASLWVFGRGVGSIGALSEGSSLFYSSFSAAVLPQNVFTLGILQCHLTLVFNSLQSNPTTSTILIIIFWVLMSPAVPLSSLQCVPWYKWDLMCFTLVCLSLDMHSASFQNVLSLEGQLPMSWWIICALIFQFLLAFSAWISCHCSICTMFHTLCPCIATELFIPAWYWVLFIWNNDIWRIEHQVLRSNIFDTVAGNVDSSCTTYSAPWVSVFVLVHLSRSTCIT